MNILGCDDLSLEKAAHLLREGEVVAFPTETVFGLGASLFHEGGIRKLYEIKKRSLSKPFTAHICDLSQVVQIAENPPDLFYKIAEKFLPGPLTLVLKKRPFISSLVTSGLDTIGIRWPRHSIALNFLKKCGFPVAATSANLSGFPCIHEKEELFKTFGDVAAIIDGGLQPEGVPSTVISLVNPKNPLLLREGSFPFQQIIDLI